jgi:hypothetical protein
MHGFYDWQDEETLLFTAPLTFLQFPPSLAATWNQLAGVQGDATIEVTTLFSNGNGGRSGWSCRQWTEFAVTDRHAGKGPVRAGSRPLLAVGRQLRPVPRRGRGSRNWREVSGGERTSSEARRPVSSYQQGDRPADGPGGSRWARGTRRSHELITVVSSPFCWC